MSVRSDTRLDMASPIDAAEGLDSDAGHIRGKPHVRSLHIDINSTLKDLCLSASKSLWKPSQSVLEAALTQKKFTNLNGEMKSCGNLKSVVMHDFSVSNISSNVDVAVGAAISSVDSNVHAANGASYAMVIPPNASISAPATIQQDSTDLAYEFREKFPGYTADNLDVNGVHKVPQRNFVLIAAEHPIMAAISENHQMIQSPDAMSVMPEGLVKISSELYDTFLPMVQQQVRSQIQVRNLSNVSATFSPVGFSSWSDYRQHKVLAAQAPIKARIARLGADSDKRQELEAQLADVSDEVDLQPCRVSFGATVTYNFLDEDVQ